jgi:hypothetical protein
MLPRCDFLFQNNSNIKNNGDHHTGVVAVVVTVSSVVDWFQKLQE